MSLLSNLNEEGFAVIHFADLQRSTEECARELGSIINIPELSLVQKLVPTKKEDAPANIYSGNFGLGDFPLHSDLAHWSVPPRYLMLRAIIPNDSVITRVIHYKSCIKGLQPALMQRALFKPRRRVSNKMYLLKLFSNEIFRWDELFLVPDNQEGELVYEHMKHINKSDKLNNICLDKKGLCLLVDNWKMLHGRSAVSDNNKDRLIERIYLSELY